MILSDTPILMLIFNRPETTFQVFEQIKKAHPQKLYISADGARKNKQGEAERCLEARSIAEKVDWQCDVKTNFSEVNLGCRRGVLKGINWFFENEEEGIIIEDDVYPSESFFGFAGAMLEKYRNDKSVYHIGGVNFQDGIKRGDGSYYFSNLSHVWGWATWRDRWKKYLSPDGKDFSGFRNTISKQINIRGFAKYFAKKLKSVSDGTLDTWDYPWSYTVWANSGKCIIPNFNLCRNLGFGADSLHTKDADNKFASAPLENIDELIHPSDSSINTQADIYTFRSHIRGKFSYRLKLKLKSIFRK
ncbi:MAG TPA: nucleotide-diphospho-sugar transferase [Ignavibacteria bacterium]|nr:nucleotide-diphospho-sugar transferase [Ignavibacteria bacterium]